MTPPWSLRWARVSPARDGTTGITPAESNVFPLCLEPNLSFDVELLSVPQRAAYSASGRYSPIWARLKKQRQKTTINGGGRRAQLSILARSSATLLRHRPLV